MNEYKLSVEFSVFVDLELDEPFADLLTTRHKIFVDLSAVEAEETERRRHTQQIQLRSQVIIRRYLLLQHKTITDVFLSRYPVIFQAPPASVSQVKKLITNEFCKLYTNSCSDT